MRPANEALLVVDIQNDFCPGGALAVPEGDTIITRVNALMEEFPHRVLTQDWHPADHSSFASNHAGAAPFSVADMAYGAQVLWPDHCVQGTAGADFHPALDVAKADFVVRKGANPAVDSYSAFFENDHETETELDAWLRGRGIDHVTIAGLAFDFCVQWSALDAVRLGYAVTVLEGACRAIDLHGSAEDARTAMLDANVVLEP
ncbi:nicotinamidase/pyrazinamidase [Rhodovulum imhoffii]|uniref:Nicotinamidase n=1 Tax=Rhodovulum imhoffii TaxID=365340 RepID=A0A2T5BTW9_9RHOB|nr:bifunctional nicotinamidase/pyrazinamidase [Rhodovulum imhoffii]MBK5933917.1 nicotinamidase [Rhodovulum imhoffii]PTN02923.1 nicotinamidase/pyrazinamidase [Rhodovulum imhoffii]